MAAPVSAGGFLAGRERELLVLHHALERVRGGRAQVVLVEGEPGLGKSTLLQAFARDLAGSCVVVRVRCDEFERNLPFAAVGLLIENAQISESSDVGAGRRLLARLSELQGGRDGPTVLAIDDAHWMDGPSRRALRFALRRLRVDPILTVIARRPGASDEVDVFTDDPGATTALRLEVLDRDAVHDLARYLRGWDIPPSDVERLRQRTGGVPLLVAAVLTGITDPSQLRGRGDVPATAAAAANRMLRSVDDQARRLVEAAAVLAEPTDLAVLAVIADVADPLAATTVAGSAGLLRIEEAGAVECAHSLLRKAVYKSMPLDRRHRLHARAAEQTTGDRRLAHRAASTVRPDPQLVADLVDAAEAATSARRYERAAGHRLRARSVSGDPVQREVLLLEALIDRVQGQDLDGAGQLAEAASHCAPTALRSLALGLLARERGQVGEAGTLLGEARRLAVAEVDPAARATSSSGTSARHQDLPARAALAEAVLDIRLGDGPAAVEVLATAVPSEDPEVAGDTRTTMGIGLWQAGRLSEALALLGSVPVSRAGTAWEAELLAARGMIRMYAGQLADALADLDVVVRLSHLWRPSTNQSRHYILRSGARYHLGDWDGAAVDAAAARALAQGGSAAWSTSLAYAVSVDVPAQRGQFEVAAEYLDQARSTLRTIASPQVADTVFQREILLADARGDHAEVLAAFDRYGTDDALSRLGGVRAYRAVMQAWITAYVGLDRLAEADSALARYEAMVRRWPEGPVPAGLGRLRGLLAEARGEPGAAQQHYATDLVDPSTLQVPFVHARLLYAAARLEHALGHRRAAIDQLTRAMSIFTRLRAIVWVGRCSLELAACGLYSPVADPLALTPREEDVVGLVSRGLTNKEVAAELFLTVKGVEFHLRNIYAKLSIASRQELRRLRTPAPDLGSDGR